MYIRFYSNAMLKLLISMLRSIKLVVNKKSLAIKPQELKCVPVILVRSGVYNVAIGSDGDDYSAIFFNKKGRFRRVSLLLFLMNYAEKRLSCLLFSFCGQQLENQAL